MAANKNDLTRGSRTARYLLKIKKVINISFFPGSQGKTRQLVRQNKTPRQKIRQRSSVLALGAIEVLRGPQTQSLWAHYSHNVILIHTKRGAVFVPCTYKHLALRVRCSSRSLQNTSALPADKAPSLWITFFIGFICFTVGVKYKRKFSMYRISST